MILCLEVTSLLSGQSGGSLGTRTGGTKENYLNCHIGVDLIWVHC